MKCQQSRLIASLLVKYLSLLVCVCFLKALHEKRFFIGFLGFNKD
ncbi:hypothetical protein AOR13_3514 [Alteromonas stellipolaris LMG 21856]|nr:hypothetical protein AOR13_3514 [Alteromonas stellipolaris LMG 21856]